MPTSWRQLKDNAEGPGAGGRIRNDFNHATGGDEGVWKPMREGYCRYRDDGWPLMHGPTRAAFTHNTVSDAAQTPTSDVGGVYTYEALAAGQIFRSELWIRDGEQFRLDGERVGEARVGRATSAGYGHVRLRVLDEPGDERPVQSTDDVALLYFESDCLLPPAASPQAALEQEFERRRIAARVCGGDIRITRNEGWIGAWNLPRPSFVCIEAGSAVRLDVSQGTEKLDGCAEEGLGLRRGEGYGAVRIGDPVVAAAIVEKDVEDGSDPNTPEADNVDNWSDPDAPDPDAQEREYLKLAEDAWLRKAIRDAAELVDRNNQLKWTDSSPNMSQLGSLRAVMGEFADQTAAGNAAHYLERMRSSDKWPGQAVEELQSLFKAPGTVWDILDLALDDMLAIGSVEEIQDGNSAYSLYAIRCVLAAAMRAHKRALEQGDDTERELEDA